MIMTITIPDFIRKKVEEICKKEMRSMSSFVVLAVIEKISKMEEEENKCSKN